MIQGFLKIKGFVVMGTEKREIDVLIQCGTPSGDKAMYDLLNLKLASNNWEYRMKGELIISGDTIKVDEVFRSNTNCGCE